MKQIAMQPPAVWMIIFGLLGFAAGALVPACQSNTVVCRPGTSRCGLGCSDFKSDSLNCGGCGVACQSLQICQDSACHCRPGSVLCSGECVVLTSAQNCGACGRSCVPDGGSSGGGAFVCVPQADGGVPQADGGAECQAQCTPDLRNCAGGCVNVRSDPLNCGECGRVCLAGQSCRPAGDGGSCTSDVIAACISTGSVVGIQAVADVAGPSVGFGTAPQALAALRGVLYEADVVDQKLEQMRLQDFVLLVPDGGFNDVGNSPNHLIVEDRYIYLVNGDGAADAGLQVFQQMLGDAGVGDAGLRLTERGTLSFDPRNPPQAVAKLGNNLYITLFSGQVAEVDVSNPDAPRITRSFDLRTLDLMGFDASVPTFARPLGIAALGGAVYVALRNLDDAGTPGGPGLLARVNLSTGIPEAIPLPTTCLTASWLGTAADAGNTLYVSCSGRAQRDAGYLISVDSSGAVAISADGGMISADGGMATWSGGCDAGLGCFPALPRRFAVVGSRLYLGDELGRVFVLENVDGGLVERRGYHSATGGLPISACSSSASGSAVVNDIIAVP